MKTTHVDVLRVRAASAERDRDVVAVEEPLEIRLAWETREKTISVTMRTPGDDFDLAIGFLFTEGVIASAEDVDAVRHWGSPNAVRVALKPGTRVDTAKLERHFYTTSSCGVCGKTSIDALRVVAKKVEPQAIAREVIERMPPALEQAQSAFRETGAIHGAALFTRDGTLVAAREDIGRHNAVDKAIGAMLRERLDAAALMVSSRASFEIVQKAIVAKISLIASVGGPSSLAVELAHEFGVTLLGFVRDGRFNVYAGEVDHG
jgi:FdhD protein